MKTYFRKTKLVAALSALSFFAAVSTSQAALLEIDFSKSGAFSGTTPSTPLNASDVFAKAIFDDGGGSGSVTLTMSVLNNLSTTGAYVKDWYFNVANAPLTGVAFTSGISTSDIDIGTNAFKANGTGGKFDFAFHFPGELVPGHTSVYTLTGAGITANSFNSVSVPAPNGGGYLGAIHVQGYQGTSAWISGQIGDPVSSPSQVPEPATLALLGLGFLGIGATRRRNK